MKIIIANSDVGAIIQASQSILKKYNTNGAIPENIKVKLLLEFQNLKLKP